MIEKVLFDEYLQSRKNSFFLNPDLSIIFYKKNFWLTLDNTN